MVMGFKWVMDKHVELDALDLAVSRQQVMLKRLRQDDKDLRYQKEAKLRELRDLDQAVNERKSRRDFLHHHHQFETRAENYDVVDDHHLLDESAFLDEEIECLEDTLAKRRAQLREADKLLLQCQTDLYEAQNKACETLRQYDKATHDLAMTKEEREELEQRSHEVAVALVQAQERLLVLEKEVEELEKKRRTVERDAVEVETLLSSKEMEIRAVEAKRDQSCKRLERLKSEVIMAEQKLSELQSSLRDGEREHLNRKSELDRLQDQGSKKGVTVESLPRAQEGRTMESRPRSEKNGGTMELRPRAQEGGTVELRPRAQGKKGGIVELRQHARKMMDKDPLDEQQDAMEKVNREIGAKQTDLRTLTCETDKHQQQLVTALQEGESEIAAIQQKVKDTKNNLDRLRRQRQETSQALDQRRDELSFLQTRVSDAEGALHDAKSAMEKQQVELKHTLEMVHIEKTELEALRMQHEAKLAELEKTQLEALQERASLEKLKEDGQRQRTDSELMREEMRRAKEDREHILFEKHSLEESIEGLMQEESALKQGCNSLESKLNHLKM
ncbi:centriolin-like [Lytechinus pictus]|uniref:centriolin-like n=1 Tax=Lytechinus pictus TaxID=7653 RepID=UPI0030BA0644